MDELGAADPRKHLGRLVDRSDPKAEREQLARDPARAAAELEHLRARSRDPRDEVTLAPPGKQRVQLDRAAVRRNWLGHVVSV